jgi:dsRNA-specific ribonuclease
LFITLCSFLLTLFRDCLWSCMDGANTLDDLFCHKEVLRSREPELFKPMEPVRLEGDNIGTSSSTNPTHKKTPVSVLEQGCMTVYGKSPTWKEYKQPTNVVQRVDCIFGGFTGIGESQTKQGARHIAAREVLLHIVRKEKRWNKFGIPGESEKEAEEYINSLSPELATSKTAKSEDWVGKCATLCSRRKLAKQPQYDFEVEGPPTDLKHICICTFNDKEIRKADRSKKAAKSACAKEMHEYLEALDINDYVGEQAVTKADNLVELGDASDIPLESAMMVANSDNPLLKATLDQVIRNANYNGSTALLSELLRSDDSVVSEVFATAEMVWVPCQHNADNGQIQVYLEIQNKNSKERLNIFWWHGLDGGSSQGARELASASIPLRFCGLRQFGRRRRRIN